MSADGPSPRALAADTPSHRCGDPGRPRCLCAPSRQPAGDGGGDGASRPAFVRTPAPPLLAPPRRCPSLPDSSGATGATSHRSIQELSLLRRELCGSWEREASELRGRGRLWAGGGREKEVGITWGDQRETANGARSSPSPASPDRRSQRPPKPGAVAHARLLWLPTSVSASRRRGDAVGGRGFGDSQPSE